MSFHTGDSVMHWVFGLGRVIRTEERDMLGGLTMYYAVQIDDMTIWVPEDEMLASRLRPPTTVDGFRKLQAILKSDGDTLPVDRHLRKNMLIEMLKEGTAESLCRVLRSLVTFRKERPLNENDQAVYRRVEKALIGEWGTALSMTPFEAETDLRSMLAQE
jgi:RNA polymerase-interacting CarD/CdnL/TRCF family regulator